MTAVLDLTPQQVETLHAEIDAYLAARPRTAHPLVTRTTKQLVAEALATPAPAGSAAPTLAPPPRATRWLPEKAWRAVGATRPRRDVSVAEYLHLTILLLERHGWTGGGTVRTRSGRRCINGALDLLHRIGYGDEHTARAAGQRVQDTLQDRGIRAPFGEWNDTMPRPLVLRVLREAAARAE